MTLDGREQRELVSTCSLDVRGRLAPPFREAGEGNSNEAKPKFELFFFFEPSASKARRRVQQLS